VYQFGTDYCDSTHTLNLFSLAGEPDWTLAAEEVITLAGAHGGEIVRSIFFDDAVSIGILD